MQGRLPVQDKKTTCQNSVRKFSNCMSAYRAIEVQSVEIGTHRAPDADTKVTAEEYYIPLLVSLHCCAALPPTPVDAVPERGKVCVWGGGVARTRRHASWPRGASRGASGRRGEDKIKLVAEKNTFKCLLRIELDISNIKAITFKKVY